MAGWALGGTVGIGTVAYALAIGPLAQFFLAIFDTSRERSVQPSTRVEVGVAPEVGEHG